MDHQNIDSNIHSKNIGLAAFQKYKDGMSQTSNSIFPIYLRPSQAERMSQKDG